MSIEVIEEILFTKKTPISTTNQKIEKNHFFFGRD